MFKFVDKPIEAHQWYENGDHPLDNSRSIQSSEGDFLSEGDVVRRYNHPKVSGSDICPKCGYRVKKHGWIDQEDFSKAVCPGDWIITVTDGYRVVDNDTFITLCKELPPLQATSHSNEPTIAELKGMDQNRDSGFSLDIIVSEFDMQYTEIAPNILACALVHKGAKFAVTGLASCLDPDGYSKKTAKEHAYNDAASKVHQFEQYRQGMNKHRESLVPKAPEMRDIGYAIRSVKSGLTRLVATRGSWVNGSFMYYVPPGNYPASRNGAGTMLGKFPGDIVPYGGYLALYVPSRGVVPYVPSMDDMIAEDWRTIPQEDGIDDLIDLL